MSFAPIPPTAMPPDVDPAHWNGLHAADAVLAQIPARGALPHHARATIEDMVLPACGGSHHRVHQLVQTALHDRESVTGTWLVLRQEWVAADAQYSDGLLFAASFTMPGTGDLVSVSERPDGDYMLTVVKSDESESIATLFPHQFMASLVRQIYQRGNLVLDLSSSTQPTATDQGGPRS